MSTQHSRELKRISSEKTLTQVLEDNWDITKERAGQKTKKMYTAIGMGFAYGIGGLVYGMGYVLIPAAIGYEYGITLVRRYGDFRDDQSRKKGCEQTQRTLREGWNDSLREWGNAMTPRLKNYNRYGLGDLLTEDINLRKVGAMIGGIAPLASWYAAHIAYSGLLAGTFWGTVSACTIWPM